MTIKAQHLVIVAGLAFIAYGICTPGVIKALAEHPEALREVLQGLQEARAKRAAAEAIQEARRTARLAQRWGPLAPLRLWIDKRIR